MHEAIFIDRGILTYRHQKYHPVKTHRTHSRDYTPGIDYQIYFEDADSVVDGNPGTPAATAKLLDVKSWRFNKRNHTLTIFLKSKRYLTIDAEKIFHIDTPPLEWIKATWAQLYLAVFKREQKYHEQRGDKRTIEESCAVRFHFVYDNETEWTATFYILMKPHDWSSLYNALIQYAPFKEYALRQML